MKRNYKQTLNDKKLIYVLNSYSNNSVQHFFHVINLLETMASEGGIEIALVIEKCEDKPIIQNPRIHIYAQKNKNKVMRALEFMKIVRNLVKDGYSKIFIRISTIAALLSYYCVHNLGAEIFFWISGAAFEINRQQPIKKRIAWYLKSYLPYCFVKRNVDYFVTGPEFMVDYYATSGKVKREKICLLYNDIDIKRFDVPTLLEKNALKKELGLNEKNVYILLVHRFSNIRKTAYYLEKIIDFLSDRKDLELIMIGSGPEEKVLKLKIEQSGLKNIRMLGSKPNAIIQKYYKACDIFINPSYVEGFPRVILEAMASGMPIVTTDAGGTSDLFEKAGKQQEYIVDVNDNQRFTEKLKDLVENKSIWAVLGQENREAVKKFSTENVAKMYINTIWR